MTVQKIQTGVLYGVTGDTKPTNYATNTIYLEQDTGNIYNYNGSSWDLFRGAAKVEELTNKTIDGADQTDMRRMQVADFVRETGSLYNSPAGQGSSGWLLGLTFLGASYTLVPVDSSHGISGNFNSATVANTSQAGNKSQAAFTYRAWNPYFRVKFMVTGSATSRVFIGFSDNGTTITSDTLLASGDEGVGIGFRTTDANWSVFNNDGSGAMVVTASGVAKGAVIRTVELQFDTSIPNCVVKLDGSTVATVTTRLPASGTPLFLYFFVETTNVGVKVFQFYNAWYEHRRTASPL